MEYLDDLIKEYKKKVETLSIEVMSTQGKLKKIKELEKILTEMQQDPGTYQITEDWEIKMLNEEIDGLRNLIVEVSSQHQVNTHQYKHYQKIASRLYNLR